jgi:diguanylate cyclase (GGDEF)-like protein
MARFCNLHPCLFGLLTLALLLPLWAIAEDPADSPEAWLEACERSEHGRPEEALGLAQQALATREQLGAYDQFRALICRSNAHTQMGQTENGLAALDEALEQLAGIENPTERIRAKSRASSVGYRLRRIDQAMELTTRSLSLAEAHQLTELMPEIIGRLAIFQSDSGQVELAIENYRRALAMLDPETQQQLIMPIRYNMAITLRRAGEFEEALEVLEPIVPGLQAPGMESRLASLLSLMGGLHFQLDNRERARTLFEQSLALHETFDNPAERAALLRELTRLYRDEGDLERSQEVAEESLQLSRRSADEQSIIHSLGFLVETLSAQGEFEQALLHHREMAERSEALLGDQLRSRLADAEAMLRDQQREAEVEQLRQERALREIEQKQQVFRQRLWSGAAFGLLGLALISLLVQRSNNRRLDRISRLDPLTGLPNRRALTAALGTGKPGPGRSVLFLLDLDHFKRINDVHGHDIGDRALVATAGLLARFAEDYRGIVGRWGGEEFALELDHLDADSASARAGELVQAIAGLRVESVAGRPIRLSASIGFAPLDAMLANSGQERWEPAMNCADQLLYRAKKAGRNTWFGVWPAVPGGTINPLELDAQIEAGECRLLQAGSAQPTG